MTVERYLRGIAGLFVCWADAAWAQPILQERRFNMRRLMVLLMVIGMAGIGQSAEKVPEVGEIVKKVGRGSAPSSVSIPSATLTSISIPPMFSRTSWFQKRSTR